MKKKYITTPLYYVNASPHIGHAYTTVASDVYARFWREYMKEDVFLLTGTDEHGQKIDEAATALGKNPKEFADSIVDKYKKLWDVCNIKYDGFIRTTDEIHKKTVQYIFDKLYKKGDIYKGKYEGWYCVPCETYFSLSDIDDKDNPMCPDCCRKLSYISEDGYFFKLSKYGDLLLKYYDEHPEFLAPKFRGKEMINFIKNGLKDLCITRTQVSWGIPVPFDEEHSIYVWFDALLNYVSAIGFLDHEHGKQSLFDECWPADVHFMGKEIYKFHTIIWPAILLSLDLPLPKTVFAHGWWTVEGDKMSKSKGNVVDPKDIIDKFGVDAFRYFILREVPFGNDGDFSMNNFVLRYNSELANDLGNLVSRTVAMVKKYFDGKIPNLDIKENVLSEKTNELKKIYRDYMSSIDFYKSLISIWELIGCANKYIEDTAPWKLAKDDSKQDELAGVLFNLLATLRVISVFIQPFIPETSSKIQDQIGVSSETIDDVWENMSQNVCVGESQVLFPRVDLK